MQQVIDILDEMIRDAEKSMYPDKWQLGMKEFNVFSCWKASLEIAKSRIQALWDGWIPVTEKLPEEISNSRILTSEDWVIRVAIYDRWWIREDNENLCYFDFWMPLPLPLNNNLYDTTRNKRTDNWSYWFWCMLWRTY